MLHQKTANFCRHSTSQGIAECQHTKDILKIKLNVTSNSLARQVIQGSLWADPMTMLLFKPPIHTNPKETPPIQLTLPCETYGMMKRILIRLGLISSNPFTLSTMLFVGSFLKIELNGQLEKYQVISITQSPFAESFLLYPLKGTMEISGETNQEGK